MEKFNNILVALDLSDIDNTLIDYASFLADTLNLEKVYFVHNIKKYEISSLFDEQLKGINLDEVIGDELNEKVESQFKGKAEWEVLISEDPYTESLINYITNKYSVPVQFSPYVPKEAMAPKIEKHAKQKSEKFLSKLDYDGEVTPLIIPGRDSSVASNLLEHAKKNKVDILIVADKGANNISNLLVGSVTEELFGEKPELPLWISK